jgi:hypothetical protein
MNDDEMPSCLIDTAVPTWQIARRRNNGALGPGRLRIGRGSPH